MNDEREPAQEPADSPLPPLPLPQDGGAGPAAGERWAPPNAGALPGTVPPAPPVPPAAPVPPIDGGPEAPVGVPEPTLPLFPPPHPLQPPTFGSAGVRARRRPSWLVPAAVALVLGLVGGFAGGALQSSLSDGGRPPGLAGGGLADVDLKDLPPLQAPGTVAQVAQAVLPSTVQILAEYDGQDAGATGSGWVLDGAGHIITNNHVVAQAAKDNGPIVVIDHQRNRYEATVVGRSAVYDLAVLYVKNPKGLTPATLGYSARLRVGEPAVARGSPLGPADTVTSGIVSYLQRPVTTGATADESSYINAVQTDAAINPGNSGGPLVNMQGEIVGVNSAIATAGGGRTTDSGAGNIGVGFAIPVEQVRVTADQILRSGKAQYPVIGAKVKTGGVPDGRGATLDEIVAGSPAEKAGLRKGDLITAINGTRVSEGIALIVAIRTFQPGQTVEFTLQRGSEQRKVKVTLDGQDG